MKQKSIDVFYAEDYCPYCGKRSLYIESQDYEFIQALNIGTSYGTKLISGCIHLDRYFDGRFEFKNPNKEVWHG